MKLEKFKYRLYIHDIELVSVFKDAIIVLGRENVIVGKLMSRTYIQMQKEKIYVYVYTGGGGELLQNVNNW